MSLSKYAVGGHGGRHLVALLCAGLVAAALPSPARAQSPGEQTAGQKRAYVESSERVRKLNDEAVRAIINEDYERAIALLEESRAMQESNIVYLNLGRAYQKLGRCEQARAALRKASEAPMVEEPPADIIDKKAAQYLGELDEQCPSPDKKLAAADTPQADKPQADKPQADEDQQQTAQPDVAQPDADDEASSGGSSVLGWSSIATGAVLIGGGVGLHFYAESRRDSIGGTGGEPASVSYGEAQDIEQSANTFDTVGVGLVAAGVVAGGLGTYFLLSDSGAEADSARVSVQPTVDGANLTFSTRW